MKKTILLLAAAFIACCGFTPADNASQSRRVPVIMYHSVCRTNVGEFVISPDSLRSDFRYLKERGYTAVSMRDIIEYCDGKGDLPLKPVVLTFDDGFYNNLYYVDKLAEEFGMKFSVSVVGAYTQKEKGETKRSPVYSYLSEEEIRQLHTGGRAELCNHTYDMHRTHPRKGVSRKAGESDEDYRAALVADSEKCRAMLEKAIGDRVEVFTYPFGSYGKGTAEIFRSLGYRALLTCKGGVNVFYKGSTEGLYCVMRYNRSGRANTEAFFKKIGV
ncbi:MAG: polysaccharide deacetylase family protein [Clostridia bacterium]|nr:polysaccharide deacetylase family protein [Clostridia bacterium]